jgi:hypothetical protein
VTPGADGGAAAAAAAAPGAAPTAATPGAALGTHAATRWPLGMRLCLKAQGGQRVR